MASLYFYLDKRWPRLDGTGSLKLAVTHKRQTVYEGLGIYVRPEEWDADHQQVVESYGSWNDNPGGDITIDFPDPSVYYIVMPGLEAHNIFSVSTTTSSHVTLTKTDATGTPYTYFLHKQ